jgi:ferrous-iron efflux pump FieF
MSDQVTGQNLEPAQSLEPAAAARLMRAATYASVAVAGTLIVVKLAAWLFTDSVSLLSTLIDSLLDAAASIINLLAVRHALAPADREHRFGHGKAEPLAALGQTAFIAGSAVFLVIEAGHRLFAPRPVLHVEVGIGVMILAIVVTFALTRFQAHVVRKTGSVAIKADSLHYLGDILVNAAVIAALLLASQFGWLMADPLFGIAIAGYILIVAWRIARGAFDMLMDRELPEPERARIRRIVLEHPSVIDMHDLRTRASGRKTFIQVHIELDGDLSLYRAHDVADEVEASLRAAYPGAEVIIHQDPYGIDEERASFA